MWASNQRRINICLHVCVHICFSVCICVWKRNIWLYKKEGLKAETSCEKKKQKRKEKKERISLDDIWSWIMRQFFNGNLQVSFALLLGTQTCIAKHSQEQQNRHSMNKTNDYTWIVNEWIKTWWYIPSIITNIPTMPKNEGSLHELWVRIIKKKISST